MAKAKGEGSERMSEHRLRRESTLPQLEEELSFLPNPQESHSPPLPRTHPNSTISPRSSHSPQFSAKSMWRRAFFKLKAQRVIAKMTSDLMNFGTNELMDGDRGYKANLDELLERKILKTERFRVANNDPMQVTVRKRWLFYPDSLFRQVWSLVLTVMLVYVAVITPFRLAFTEDVFFDGWTIFELALDGLFCLDILVNFFSCYQLTNGRIIDSRLTIAKNYVKTWFLIDLISSIPFTIIDLFLQNSQNPGYNKFLKLTRLPRLYKLFRLAKLIRFLKVYESNPTYERIQDCFQESSRIVKLFKFSVLVSLCIHLMACFWYFSARFADFSPDTWVVRNSFVDEGMMYQYLAALYWTVTTTVTVGYGDISARTELEMVLSICWMLIGVGFYTYTVGSLSSFLISIDTKDSILASKMAAVNEFASQTGISHPVKLRVREAIRYTTNKTGNVWSDKHSLFDDIPRGLQYEVALSMYGGVVKDLQFFANRGRPFTLYFVPIMKPMILFDGEYVYKIGDFADEMYFITKGRVNLVLFPQEISYKSYLRGSYLGEIEIVKAIRRIDNAVAFGETEVLTVSNQEFINAMDMFPIEAKEIQHLASERFRRHREAMLEITQLLQLKKQRGSLHDYVGKRLITVEIPVDTELTQDQYLKK